jgi:hypothetical protein
MCTVLLGLGIAPAFAAATWTATEAPLPANAAPTQIVMLQKLSCPTVSWCVAIGHYADTSGNGQPLIETLAGGIWTPSEVALPANAIDGAGQVSSVACPTVGFCVAVGDYFDSNLSYDGFIDTLSNGTWTTTDAPVPADVPLGTGYDVTLGPLACGAAGSCAVFGRYQVNGPQIRQFVDTLSDGSWTATDTPLPSNAYSSPDGTVHPRALTCPAPGSCVAVGDYWFGSGLGAGLIETLSNGTWTATEAPQPPSTASAEDNSLTSVTCPAVGSCEAIGEYRAANNDGQSDIDTLVGGTWTEIEAPSPSNVSTATDADNMSLTGLDCPALGSCTAVGSYVLSGSEATAPLIETLAGGTWTPTNASAGPALQAVSCPAVGSCVALGLSSNLPVIDSLAAGTWTVTAVPLPFNADRLTVVLNALSCPAVGSCFSVGQYSTPSNGQEGLIETLPGTTTATVTSATATRPALSTMTLGQSNTDAATVTGNATYGSPTGSVRFYVCGPTTAATPCAYLSDPVGTPVSLSPAVGNASTATSASFTPPGGGSWCFAAYYSGDAHYSASFDATGDGCFFIPRAGTSTVLTPSASTILIGQAVSVVATIAGNVAHGSPTGTVNFYICYEGAAPTPCTSTDSPMGLDVTLTAKAGDTSTTTSATYAAAVDTGTGYYCFAADYSGDGNYDPSSDVTPDGCVDVTSLTQTTVTASPALSTIMLGQSDTDTASVTGNTTYGVPTGAITFYACGPTAGPVECVLTLDDVVGVIDLTATGTTTSTATSAPFTPDSAGYWCFFSAYGGNGSYAKSFDTTTDQCFDVVTNSPSFTSAAAASAVPKKAFSFSVTVTGSADPSITASGLPKWLTLTNLNNGTATLKSAKAKKGRYRFTLKAASGGLSVTQAFTLTVKK